MKRAAREPPFSLGYSVLLIAPAPAVAAASTAAVAAPSAASTLLSARTRHVHGQPAPVQFVFVKHLNGLERFSGRRHFDKREALGLARIPVQDERDVLDLACLAEKLA